jgi:hypothetical protein
MYKKYEEERRQERSLRGRPSGILATAQPQKKKSKRARIGPPSLYLGSAFSSSVGEGVPKRGGNKERHRNGECLYARHTVRVPGGSVALQWDKGAETRVV